MRLTTPWSAVEARIHIAAPPEAVFDAIADPDTYPDWLVGTKRMRAVDPGFPAPGRALHHTVGVADPLTIDDSSEVVDVEPNRRLGLRVHLGPIDGDVELLVLPHPDGTEVRFRERPRGWAAVLIPVLRPVLYARNKRSLDHLAHRFDGR